MKKSDQEDAECKIVVYKNNVYWLKYQRTLHCNCIWVCYHLHWFINTWLQLLIDLFIQRHMNIRDTKHTNDYFFLGRQQRKISLVKKFCYTPNNDEKRSQEMNRTWKYSQLMHLLSWYHYKHHHVFTLTLFIHLYLYSAIIVVSHTTLHINHTTTKKQRDKQNNL